MVNPLSAPIKTQVHTQISGHPLITKERTQQLELLTHLVTNLSNGIVVCGPEGIGKTRLLNSFKETKIDSWIYCWLNGDSNLSLERIQELLSETMGRAITGINLPSLGSAFDRLAKLGSKVVLIIDDAGSLAPGLIESIITFAQDKPVLRIVFALTHSEMYLKNNTDPDVDNCYHIEIPALSEQQCGDFLEYLAALPNPRIQFDAINESRVAELYRETHGIPGNILAQLPKNETEKQDYSKIILVSAVFGLVIIALGMQWWSSRQKSESDEEVTAENKVTKLARQQSLAKPANPLPEKQVIQEPQLASDTLNASKTSEGNNNIVHPAQATDGQGLNPDKSGSAAPISSTGNEKPPQPQTNDAGHIREGAPSGQTQLDPISPVSQEGHWLMAQPAENYTLQLMTLSNEQTIFEVLQRHRGLGQNLRYIKTKKKNGRDRFVLLYGSFSSPDQAIIEKQQLPKELQKTWLRKISAVQNEMNSATPTDAPATSTDTLE